MPQKGQKSFAGKKHSDEAKLKMSKAKKGKTPWITHVWRMGIITQTI